MRTFLTIMRDLYRSRRAGVSVQVAMLALDDADWSVIWDRLVKVAKLDSRLQKYRPRR